MELLPSAMPNRLVIGGPYRWIRNPMAVAGIVQGAAIGVILQSWLVVASEVVGSLLWNYAIRPNALAALPARAGSTASALGLGVPSGDARRFRSPIKVI